MLDCGIGLDPPAKEPFFPFVFYCSVSGNFKALVPANNKIIIIWFRAYNVPDTVLRALNSLLSSMFTTTLEDKILSSPFYGWENGDWKLKVTHVGLCRAKTQLWFTVKPMLWETHVSRTWCSWGTGKSGSVSPNQCPKTFPHFITVIPKPSYLLPGLIATIWKHLI